MKRALLSLLTPALLLMSLPCRGADDEPLAPEPSAAAPRRDVTRYLPTTSSATAGSTADVTSVWGGYDGASGAPLFSASTEVRLVRRVSLMAGVTYATSYAASTDLRPHIGARVQFLEQPSSGVDATAAFVFRQDRFTSEDGLFQGSLAVGRSFGETSAVLNVVYGQDGEGDDHEGEVRVAVTRRIVGELHLGAEGRYMHAIASTDPHRAALGTPSMEALVGPVVAYTAGRWAVIAEAGVASRQTSRVETGVTALAGVGASF
jgi:hypothetical protein